MKQQNLKALVLAAGKGTRLQTEGITLPKVMRQAAGRPLLAYVLDALSFLPREDIILVVGYHREDVLAAFPDYPHAVQDEQLGTGHAVQCAQPLLKGFSGSVLVCCGDMPLMKKSTYEALEKAHREAENACTILSGVSDEALPYGRVIRTADGGFDRIVEEKDCTPEERSVQELNAGVYLFQTDALLDALTHLRRNNAQGEYYLTDVPAFIRDAGGKVGVCAACTPLEMLGVNTPTQLRQVEETIRLGQG
ncbi:MAG: NTP transferase domain-containing protein [Intestinimonas sp.]|jgi:bifunctional UDP-N-acetylglucosamine pyrophosphorylase/glucosamine-1-phosphate N-acetyltransferase/UDP-N-acetylglucosamine pyrophosphorylase|nr:NTP transferase domain-containing protein [Intestinimonas sp.]